MANTLRHHIESGEYRPGDWLPTERSLAESLGVDRRVIRTAVNRLVESGLVIRRPHCRPIVGSAAAAPSNSQAANTATSPSASTFIALLMWRGGQLERAVTSQQRIFWGMNQALADAGRHAVFMDLGTIGSEEENAEREAEQLRYVLEGGFGGAVFYPYAYRRNRALAEELAAAMPLVTIDRQIASVSTDFVCIDNHQATYEAVMHLAARGHRRIAYVTKNEPIQAVQDRIQGYIDAMRAADLNELILPIPSGDNQQEWTVVDAVFQLPENKRPTAAAAFNDFAAVNLMKHLAASGLSVPEDVALVGFDDIVSTLPNGVGLTTVAQPYEEIGRKAAELLLLRLKDRSAPLLSVELPGHLMVRESSGPNA